MQTNYQAFLERPYKLIILSLIHKNIYLRLSIFIDTIQLFKGLHDIMHIDYTHKLYFTRIKIFCFLFIPAQYSLVIPYLRANMCA